MIIVILKVRKEWGEFKFLVDLCDCVNFNVFNSCILEFLIKCGVFD